MRNFEVIVKTKLGKHIFSVYGKKNNTHAIKSIYPVVSKCKVQGIVSYPFHGFNAYEILTEN